MPAAPKTSEPGWQGVFDNVRAELTDRGYEDSSSWNIEFIPDGSPGRSTTTLRLTNKDTSLTYEGFGIKPATEDNNFDRALFDLLDKIPMNPELPRGFEPLVPYPTPASHSGPGLQPQAPSPAQAAPAPNSKTPREVLLGAIAAGIGNLSARFLPDSLKMFHNSALRRLTISASFILPELENKIVTISLSGSVDISMDTISQHIRNQLKNELRSGARQPGLSAQHYSPPTTPRVPYLAQNPQPVNNGPFFGYGHETDGADLARSVPSQPAAAPQTYGPLASTPPPYHVDEAPPAYFVDQDRLDINAIKAYSQLQPVKGSLRGSLRGRDKVIFLELAEQLKNADVDSREEAALLQQIRGSRYFISHASKIRAASS